jgi:hypothetical protein
MIVTLFAALALAVPNANESPVIATRASDNPCFVPGACRPEVRFKNVCRGLTAQDIATCARFHSLLKLAHKDRSGNPN